MRITRILLAIAILSLINPVFANQDNKISIAIITDNTSGLDKSPLVSLLEVELSQRENVRLLERAAIDKILDEHKLSAAGLLDRNNTIKIGKLLRADAFIILSTENTATENQSQESGDLIRVRISETAHGLRLLDFFEQSDTTSLENIVQKLESVLNKINQPDEKLIPVGIVDIHRVQLGEQYKMLERTLPTMLSVRLSLEPQIIVLEREDLKVLLDEKLMTEGEDTEFWSSAILIDGYLKPNNGQLELHLNLKQAGGDILESIVVQVEPNESLSVINRAVAEITKQLHDSPPVAKWQPEQEAKQFYIQGQMFKKHLQYKDAISHLEIAHYLQPQNVYYTGALFENIWEIRYEVERVLVFNRIEQKNVEKFTKENPLKQYIPMFQEPPDCPYTDMELTELLSIFVRQIAQDFQNDKLSFQTIFDKFSRCLGRGGFSRDYFSSSASVATEEIKRINKENRRIWVETFGAAIQSNITKYGYSAKYCQRLALLAWISSDELNELMYNLKKVISDFVMPPELGGKISSAQEREKTFQVAFLQVMKMISPMNLEQTHLKDISEDFSRQWHEYIQEITNEENNFLGIKGQMTKMQGISRLTEQKDREQLIDENLKTIETYIDEFITSNDSLDIKTKLQYMNDIGKLLCSRTLLKKYNEKILIWKKLCEFLINKNDIDSLIEINAVTSSPFRRENFGNKNDDETKLLIYQLWGQMAEVIKTRSSPKAITALGLIHDAQIDFTNHYPELFPPTPETKLPVKMILTQEYCQEEMGLYNISLKNLKIEYKDDMLWIAFRADGLSAHNTNIGLAGIDISNRTIKSLWAAEIPFERTRNLSSINISIDKDACYIAATGSGILELPGTSQEGKEYFVEPKTLNSSMDVLAHEFSRRSETIKKRRQQKTYNKPKIITKKNGLPSLSITSIARNENTLWIAYGTEIDESGLGLYNLNTNKWETIFCSTLKEESPFSNGHPYEISSMLLASDKIFFNVSGLDSLEPWNSELWKLNINTREYSYIKPFSGEFIRNLNDKVWIRSSTYLVEFEPETEAMELLIRERNDMYIKAPKRGRYIYGLKENLFAPDTFLNKVDFGRSEEGNLDLSKGTIHKNMLWARYGKSQIIIAEKGKSFDEARIIENNLLEGKPILQFFSTPYGLVGIGDSSIGLIETEDMKIF